MPGTTLREGVAADLDAMYALDLVCFEEPFRFDFSSMRRYVLHPEAIVLVAESDGRMGGFIVVNPARRRALHAAYITTLDVHPNMWRRGIARQLVAEAERRAAAVRATTMQLHVHTGNTSAICLYESAGYERVMLTGDFYAPGLDAWSYVKALPVALRT